MIFFLRLVAYSCMGDIILLLQWTLDTLQLLAVNNMNENLYHYYKVKNRVSYPAALIDNPVRKTVLEIVECHLLYLSGNSRAHSSHLHGRLRQSEHASNCLPSGVAADIVTDQLLEPTDVAV